MPRQEVAVLGEDRLGNFTRHNSGTKRDVAARKSFRQRGDIRVHPVVVEGTPGTATPRATHDLVGNQKDIVAIANRPHSLCVTGRARYDTAGSTYHRLEDECRNSFGTDLLNALFELPRKN